MVDMGRYEFKYFKRGNITPEESFMNNYAQKLYELENVYTSNKLLRVILDAKY